MENIIGFIRNRYIKQHDKLFYLLKFIENITKTFYRTVNLSSVHFNNNEINLLSKGLKYYNTLKTKASKFENLAIDLELVLNTDTAFKYLHN